MRKRFLLHSVLLLASLPSVVLSQGGMGSLPVFDPGRQSPVKGDWLLGASDAQAGVYRSADGRDLVLYNGLVRRVFRVTPNAACTDLSNLSTGQQLLRSVRPEARFSIDGRACRVGGLSGQREHAYLRSEWIDSLRLDEGDFRLDSVSVGAILPRFSRKARAWSGARGSGTGRHVAFHYRAGDPAMASMRVSVHYELYDGMPLIVKWLTVQNLDSRAHVLGNPVHEILALVEEESSVGGSAAEIKRQHGLYVEVNYGFSSALRSDVGDQAIHWKTDSLYRSQVNYMYQTPCVLEVYPEKLTALTLKPGEVFESPRSYELLMDGYDRQRRGLAIRKMYRAVAPWVLENPIFMHLVSRDDRQVRDAVDQCVATGYESLILSFGSHLNMEDTSRANLDRWRELARYAHERGILIGGYSLFSSRRISDADDVIDPVTGKPDVGAVFGNAPCMGSRWGLDYLERLKRFFTHTDFDLFENDGPYPGDVCASVTHPGHEGLHDSQWRQMELQKGLYRWLHERGVYINAPDWYYMDGTNKSALGYRETNFSLSREQQKILNRQNIHDGLLEKTPSMGWGFVPLVKYHGGGPEAVLEPLSVHLKDYVQLMMQYYGAGVQACYRGPRLFDTEETRLAVVRTTEWYKRHRAILNADVIQLRRADGRDWDGLLHADPSLPEKGLLMLYNPLSEEITRTIRLPLYYTGLTGRVRIREGDGNARTFQADARGEVSFTFKLGPGAYAWYVISE